MPTKKSDIDVEARMRELEAEIRRTVPPRVSAPETQRAVTRAPLAAPSDSSQTQSRGIIPSLGLAAVLVVGGVVSWFLIKHIVVTLFWVAALGVVGWAGWKIWRKKKVRDQGKGTE